MHCCASRRRSQIPADDISDRDPERDSTILTASRGEEFLVPNIAVVHLALDIDTCSANAALWLGLLRCKQARHDHLGFLSDAAVAGFVVIDVFFAVVRFARVAFFGGA